MFKIFIVLVFAVMTISVSAGVPVPSVPDLQSQSDSGLIAGDNLTKATAPNFNVAGVTVGATVELLRNGNPVASIVATGTSVVLADAMSPPEGTLQYTARQTISGNISSPSAALAVTFDRTAPTVTVNQAAGQADPATVLPIKYTVTFSEQVYCLNIGLPGPFGECFELKTFNMAGSTAFVQSAYLTLSGESPTYELSVRYIRSPGSVIVALNANAFFFDIAGNPNVASTSTDNAVMFNPPLIHANMKGTFSTVGGGGVRPGTMARLTDTTTGQIYIAPVTLGGQFSFTGIPIYDVQDQPFILEAFRKRRVGWSVFVMTQNYTHPGVVVEY